MGRDYITRSLAIVGVLSAVALPCISYGQSEYTDCRETSCTSSDLVRALSPPLVTRGVTRPAVAPTGPGVAPTGPGVALNIHFDSNSTKISPKYRGGLNELGKALSELSLPTIEIAGHTDSIGSERANQILSERRAESVKQYLVQNSSIPQERLIAKGYGKSQPIAPNDTPKDRSKNRRIEIVRTGQ